MNKAEQIQQDNFFKVEAMINSLKEKGYTEIQAVGILDEMFNEKVLEDYNETKKMRDYYGND